MSCAINCQDIGTHTSEDLLCKGARPAGASSIVIYFCLDNIDDITDPQQTIDAIAADEAVLVENIRFGSGAPNPIQSPKTVSCGSPGVLHIEYPLNITDYSYNASNNDFWQTMGGGVTAAAILAWDCTKASFTDTSRYYLPSAGSIVLAGGLVSPDDSDEAARFEITGTFKGTLDIITTPAGIFS